MKKPFVAARSGEFRAAVLTYGSIVAQFTRKSIGFEQIRAQVIAIGGTSFGAHGAQEPAREVPIKSNSYPWRTWIVCLFLAWSCTSVILWSGPALAENGWAPGDWTSLVWATVHVPVKLVRVCTPDCWSGSKTGPVCSRAHSPPPDPIPSSSRNTLLTTWQTRTYVPYWR
jgi:hypothetical protein